MLRNKVVQVVNENGTPFNVRIVEKGERYGRDECIEHDEDMPLVEFYDARYIQGFGVLGQFVSRYYESTLINHPIGGLQLYGGVSSWFVDGENLRDIKNWLVEDLAIRGMGLR